jgi:integrase
MALFKRGKVWWMRFNYNGKQVRRSTEVTNKKTAERIHAKVLTEIEEGKWFERLPGEEKTLAELMHKYREEHTAINKAPSAYKKEQSPIKHLLRFFEDMKLTEIRSKHVAAYKKARVDEGAAPKTINNELILMGHAYKLAMREWEWVRENPVSNVSKLKVSNFIERWLKPKEEARLLAASPDWLQDIIIFAVNTGLRQGEILKLSWDRIDFQRQTLTILEQKNGERDTLPLNEKATEVLRARGKVRLLNTNLVFLSQAQTALDASNIIRAFHKARKEARLTDLRFHDLRHTFATRLVQAGVDIYKVQKLMRHKSPQMTQRYAHHNSESLRDGVEVLDQISTILAQSDQFKKKGATAVAVTP